MRGHDDGGMNMEQARTARGGVAVSAPLCIAVAIIVALGTLAGCRTVDTRLVNYAGYTLQPVQYSRLNGWSDDNLAEVLPALRETCNIYRSSEPSQPLGLGGRAGVVGDWLLPCDTVLSAGEDPEALRAAFQEAFQPYRVIEVEVPEALITGYYEPFVNATRRSTAGYTYPILMRPNDMVELQAEDLPEDWPLQTNTGRVVDWGMEPYYDRGAIVDGALAGRNLELGFVDDPLALYIMQEAGAGIIVYGDGTATRVVADGDNGYAPSSMVRVLISRGVLPREGARWGDAVDWMRQQPDRGASAIQLDQRYVFFKTTNAAEVVGPQGFALTPGRSLAVDTRLLPIGLPAWIDTGVTTSSNFRIQRMVVTQDDDPSVEGFSAGAVYWGTGEEAVEAAETMSGVGRLFLFLPAQVSELQIETAD